MSAEIKKIVKAPVEATKKIVAEVAKPAEEGNVYKIAVGAIASPVVGYFYGKAFDMISGYLPTGNTTVVKIVKILLPLVPAVIVQKFKIPAGGIISGSLYGTFFLQLAMELWNLLSGKIKLPTISKVNEYSAEQLEVSNDWGVF